PTVLYPLTLPALLDYVLTTQSSTSPTLLVICSSRDIFLQDLATSLQHHGEGRVDCLEQLAAPTLHNLLTTRYIKLAFCASVQALLAYLTAYGRPDTKHGGDAEGRKRVVLVNPLALHAPTSSFSAQGLSRVFATAAETALTTAIQLHVVECEGRRNRIEGAYDEDAEMDNGHGETQVEAAVEDPWEQEVSILNVSARRFGSGTGERAWAGRTVKAKRIAGRWFHFHSLHGHQTHHDQG
ncbi:hypothetical protein EJ02DRAFT_308576, partial [Clathrospora elynae]